MGWVYVANEENEGNMVMAATKRWQEQQGAALLGTILIVTMLMVLGVGSLFLATQEIRSAQSASQEVSARYLAESGIALVQRWFHDSDFLASHPASGHLAKQHHLPGYGPSFYDAQGGSQFTGTAQYPDLMLQASNQADHVLLNDVRAGWLRSLGNDGRILNLRLFRPTRKGLLNSLTIEAERSGIRRTVTVQMGASGIPPISVGAMIQQRFGSPLVRGVPLRLPVEVHWGDLKVKGDVHLGRPFLVPAKTGMGPVNGSSYRQMGNPEDRWFDMFVGGNIVHNLPVGTTSLLALNMYEQQDPLPGVHSDAWDYTRMKRVALQEGSYFVLGTDGLLYDSATSSGGLGRDPNLVLASKKIGDHRGLIFIDTLDQQPPGPMNLGQLTLNANYIEGLLVINAHVHWNPKGSGKVLSTWSPPDPASGAKVQVPLSGIHLQGVLSVAGDVTFQGNPRVFGAVIVGGGVRASSLSHTPLEIWYDHDFHQGLFRGVPSVFLAPGTWYELY